MQIINHYYTAIINKINFNPKFNNTPPLPAYLRKVKDGFAADRPGK